MIHSFFGISLNSSASRPIDDDLIAPRPVKLPPSRAAISNNCCHHSRSRRQPCLRKKIKNENVNNKRNKESSSSSSSSVVTFCPTVHIKRIASTSSSGQFTPPSSNSPTVMKRAVWYDQSEIDKRIKRDFQILWNISNFDSTPPLVPSSSNNNDNDKNDDKNEEKEEDDFCTRGLEGGMTQGLCCRRKSRRLIARNAVLNEQQRQASLFGKEERDADQLARVYALCTIRSRNAAYQLALQDEQYVQNHVHIHYHRSSNSDPMTTKTRVIEGSDNDDEQVKVKEEVDETKTDQPVIISSENTILETSRQSPLLHSVSLPTLDTATTPYLVSDNKNVQSSSTLSTLPPKGRGTQHLTALRIYPEPVLANINTKLRSA